MTCRRSSRSVSLRIWDIRPLKAPPCSASFTSTSRSCSWQADIVNQWFNMASRCIKRAWQGSPLWRACMLQYTLQACKAAITAATLRSLSRQHYSASLVGQKCEHLQYGIWVSSLSASSAAIGGAFEVVLSVQPHICGEDIAHDHEAHLQHEPPHLLLCAPSNRTSPPSFTSLPNNN